MNQWSETIHIWTIGTHRVCFVSMSSDPRVHARGWGWRSKTRSPLKCAVYNVNVSSLKFIS